MKGIVFDIQRNSLNDGPGIRTTVFLKGCSLNCLWCHNEESVDIRPALRYHPDKCTDCMECVQTCRSNAHHIQHGKHQLDFKLCTRNWDCVSVCTSAALSKTGYETDVETLLHTLVKDLPYYKNSGGGVTISGGEPMTQFSFTLSLLKALKKLHIHTCLDTTGNAPWHEYEQLLAYTDLFLFDYKETDPMLHLAYTGIDQADILENLEMMDKARARIILRCPIIPGLNDREDHFKAISQLSLAYKSIQEIHLLSYHTMGLGKGLQHGFKNPQKEYKVPGEEEKMQWKASMNAYGCRNLKIF